jgi:predicted small secreted protein
MRFAFALLAATALLLTGCGSSSGGGSDTAAGTVKTIKVAVKDGKVVPATHREDVPKGDEVRLIVTTDTADEVHVHGVNIEKETEPGKPITITFTAKDAGIYEVETHKSNLVLMQLEVR